MKWFFISLVGLAVLFLVVFFVFSKPIDDTAKTNATLPTQLELAQDAVAGVSQADVHVIDVRTAAEWEEAHAMGAVWWGLEEELQKGNMPGIDLDDQVYIYCRSGNRSAEAATILRDNGYENIYDIGAFTNWTDAGGASAAGDIILP